MSSSWFSYSEEGTDQNLVARATAHHPNKQNCLFYRLTFQCLRLFDLSLEVVKGHSIPARGSWLEKLCALVFSILNPRYHHECDVEYIPCHHPHMNHSAGKTTEGASPGAESAASCVQTSGGQLRGHSAS
uniref:Uncharacterized protein n=1 Tax=Arundo donax TaxID=35708 RepID=A0A0A9DQF8_ARUDO